MKENKKSEKYFYMVLHNCRKIIKIISGVMAFRLIKFWDVGALVWFAHIVEWQFLYVQY